MIFLSYKSNNRPLAQRVLEQIETWGHKTFFDKRDIPSGMYFRRVIDSALDQSDWVIGIMTSLALESDEVQLEWDHGFRRKRLIPLKFEECRIPYHLVGTQYIDFTTDLAHGFASLESTLGIVDREKLNLPIFSNSEIVVHSKPLTAKEKSFGLFSPNQQHESPSEDSRESLLKSVREKWIDAVLEKWRHDHPVELGMVSQPTAVLHHSDFGSCVLGSNDSILEVFKSLDQEMLILGNSGSGKTFTMLQLTDDLLKEAEIKSGDKLRPIPVILNLASWAQKKLPIDKWVFAELDAKYQVPIRISQTWLEDASLLLLLDGLDEVDIRDREQCVIELNRFRKPYSKTKIVICSRTEAYALLNNKLSQISALEIQPLSQPQIDQYVNEERLGLLRELLSKNPVAAQMSKTLLFLNILYYLYKDGDDPKLANHISEASLSHQMFRLYIDKRLRENPSSLYSSSQTIKYLSLLASQLAKHSQTEFLIEQIQPYWLEDQATRKIYYLRVGLIWGACAFIGWWITFALSLVVVLFAGIKFSFIEEISYSAPFAFTVALIAGATVAFLTISRGAIEPVEELHWSRTAMLRFLPISFFTGTGIGLVGGILLGLIISPNVGIGAGLILGIGAGLSIGFVLGVARVISFGFESRPSLSKVEPNEGVMRSARNARRMTPVYGLVLMLSGALVSWIAYHSLPTAWGLLGWLTWGALLGLNGGIFYSLLTKGGLAVSQHIVLRQLLYRSNSIPWNYAEFLDYCSESALMRKIGGGYIFIHRALLDYLAK